MTDRARLTAARCLVDVQAGAYSNLAFKKRASGLDGRDAGFAAALFYGTLERMLTLTWMLDRFVKKGTDSLDAEVRAVLLTGLYQCLYLDGVPVRAAVNESVEVCRALRKSSAAGLVNAVLRRAAALELTDIDNIPDSVLRDSVKYSLCPGLVSLLREQYGQRADAVMAGMFSDNATAVRVNTSKTDADTLLSQLHEQGMQAEHGPLPGSLIIRGGDYLRSDALQSGLMRVQSLAAQRAALALDARPGMRVLDLCAAPGGKTLTVAQQMENAGHITALDVHDHRVRLIREASRQEGASIVTALCADGTTWRGAEPFDRVLCDVPCSGYGEIHSKPELRYKEPARDGSLLALQAKLLDNGAAQLKAGGVLVYATCTIDQRENDEQVNAFLARSPGFRLVPTAEGENPSRFLPGFGGSEGFYIATFERMW